MIVVLVAVGKIRGTPYEALLQDYLRRFTSPIAVTELDERKTLSPIQLRQREGEMLAEKIPPASFVVALDPRGKIFSSENLAAFMRQHQDGGMRDICFIVGGADGLSDDILARSQLRLSLGAMIWPHLLARVMLVEQLYRTQQILAGHPYHRGSH